MRTNAISYACREWSLASLGVHKARDLKMADDNTVNMTSDGDDDQGDILPPTKKYQPSRLAFSVASVDGATLADHEGSGDGEACDMDDMCMWACMCRVRAACDSM